MGALTDARMTREFKTKRMGLPLASGQKVYLGGIACGDSADGTVKKGAASTTLLRIGEFAETVDNSAGTGSTGILVDLDREITCRWYDNATGNNAVAATDLFNDVYIQDDHTVTKASSGNSKAGRVWAVDTNKGVAVEAYTL
jgi:hypothetical protein